MSNLHQEIVRAYCGGHSVAEINSVINSTTKNVQRVIDQASRGHHGPGLQIMMYNYEISLRALNFPFTGREVLLIATQMGATADLMAPIMETSASTVRNRLDHYRRYPWVVEWLNKAKDTYEALRREVAYSQPETIMQVFIRFVVFKQTLHDVRSKLHLSEAILDVVINNAVAGKAGRTLQVAFSNEVARRVDDPSTGKEAMLRAYNLPIMVSLASPMPVPSPQNQPQRQLANMPAALVETTRSPSPLPVAPVVARSPSPLPVAPVVARSPTPSLPRSPTPPPPCSPSPSQPQHVGEVPWISSAPVESDQNFGDPWQDALSFFDPPENEFRMDDY
jgi:hypothetical protein